MAKINLNFIYLQLKNCFCNLFFWLKLLLIIVFIFLVKQINFASNQDSLVLLYNDGSEYGYNIIESIMRKDYDGFVFEESYSINSLKTSVQKNEAVCGIVFGDDFDIAVEKGVLNDSVTFIQSASSIDGYAIKELIFPYILEAASNTLIKKYINSTTPNVDPTALIYVSNLNDSIRRGMNISIFKIVECDNANSTPRPLETSNRPYTIALWLIFATSLVDVYSIFEQLKDYLIAKRPIYRFIFTLEGAMISTVMISLAIGLIFFPSKVLSFLLYGIICSLYSYLLKLIIRNLRVYSAIIPVLNLLCLLICPIIYDFSTLIPGIGYLAKIVPITYFAYL